MPFDCFGGELGFRLRLGGFGSGAGACFWVDFLVWFPCGRRSSWFDLSGCFTVGCGSTGVLWLVTAGFRWFGGGGFGCGGVWMFRGVGV